MCQAAAAIPVRCAMAMGDAWIPLSSDFVTGRISENVTPNMLPLSTTRGSHFDEFGQKQKQSCCQLVSLLTGPGCFVATCVNSTTTALRLLPLLLPPAPSQLLLLPAAAATTPTTL